MDNEKKKFFLIGFAIAKKNYLINTTSEVHTAKEQILMSFETRDNNSRVQRQLLRRHWEFQMI